MFFEKSEIDLAEFYLVTLYVPDFQNPTVQGDQVKLVLFVENCTSIGSRIVCQIQTRRIRLRSKMSNVAQSGQCLAKETEVINFLQANHVSVVSRDLFDHPEPASGPFQGLWWALDEIVVASSKCYGKANLIYISSISRMCAPRLLFLAFLKTLLSCHLL